MCPSVWFPSERDASHQSVIILDRQSIEDVKTFAIVCVLMKLCESMRMLLRYIQAAHATCRNCA